MGHWAVNCGGGGIEADCGHEDSTNTRVAASRLWNKAERVSQGTRANRGAPCRAAHKSPTENIPAEAAGFHMAMLVVGSVTAIAFQNNLVCAKTRLCSGVAEEVRWRGREPTACAAAITCLWVCVMSVRVFASMVETSTAVPRPHCRMSLSVHARLRRRFQNMGCGSKRRKACLARRAVRKWSRAGAPAPPWRRRREEIKRPGWRAD